MLPKPSPEGGESELHFEEWPNSPANEYDYKFAAICLICSETRFNSWFRYEDHYQQHKWKVTKYMTVLKQYEIEELIDVLRLRSEGHNNASIAQKIGRTHIAVSTFIPTLVQAVYATSDAEAVRIVEKNTNIAGGLRLKILQVREMIQSKRATLERREVVEQVQNEITPAVEQTVSSDRFDLLDKAFADFQSNILNFIAQEAILRSEEQLKNQKTYYEEKIQELEDQINKKQNSSFVDSIRQKFEKKGGEE